MMRFAVAASIAALFQSAAGMQIRNQLIPDLIPDLPDISKDGLAENLPPVSLPEEERVSFASDKWNTAAPTLPNVQGMNAMNWSLCHAKFHSNLGNDGPNKKPLGEASLRFFEVGVGGDGQKVDLVITANSSYEAHDTMVNGLVGDSSCFGVINVRSSKSGKRKLDLLFQWVKTGTNVSVAPEKFFFSMYDGDMSATATEQITFYNRVNEVFIAPNSELDMTGDLESGLTFTSTALGNGGDNPRDPFKLTAKQAARSVTVDILDQHMWKVSFTVLGGKNGRNFIFGANTSLTENLPIISKTTTMAKAGTTTVIAPGGAKSADTTTPCAVQSCEVWADPHVSGFDNNENKGPSSLALLSETHAGKGKVDLSSKVGMYTFDRRPVDVNSYDAGDFWLVKSEPVHIQGRFRLSGEFVPDRAAIGAVAVGGPFLEGHKFIVEPMDGKVTFDGKTVPNHFEHEAGISLKQDRHGGVEAELPMGIKLLFRRLNKHVDVKISMPELPGGVDGECGNFDGITENDDEANLLARMGSLMIDKSSLLFQTTFDGVAIKSDADASEAEITKNCNWDCYLQRYPSLRNEKWEEEQGNLDYARKHYIHFGHAAGKNCQCDANIVPRTASVGEMNMLALKLMDNAADAEQAEDALLAAEQSEVIEKAKAEAEVLKECDWSCYLDRFPKLKNEAWEAEKNNIDYARSHYLRFGRAAGKNCKCTGPKHVVLEQIEADETVESQIVATVESKFDDMTKGCNWNCYLQRYPRLRNEKWEAEHGNQDYARDHFIHFGKAAGRDCKCEATPKQDSIMLYKKEATDGIEVPAWTSKYWTDDSTSLAIEDGKESLDWELCHKRYHSNLGGLGPNIGEASIRYESVGVGKDGTAVDLVVTVNSSDYVPQDTEVNGLVGEGTCFGVINVKSDKDGTRSIDVLFNWFEAGTNKSVAPERFYFTMYDSDSSKTAHEQVVFHSRVNSVFLPENPELTMSGDLASGLTFTSTTLGNGGDNPRDPYNLTPQQQARSVTVDFIDHSMWKLNFNVMGGKRGRNFIFGGKTILAEQPPVKAETTTLEGKETTTMAPKATTTVDGSEKCVMCGTECCPEPATTTPCETQSCQVWADPHVSGFDNSENQGPDSLALISINGETKTGAWTFDGRPVDVNAYDTGDFWLVKSEPVHIQARFRLSGEFIPDRAAIGAVAVGGPFLKGHSFIVEALDGKVTFDGKKIALGNSTHSELLTLRQTADTVEAELPMGITLLLRRLNKHVDVKITMPEIPGGVDGECGNYDGIAENDEEHSIEARMKSLMIDKAQLLFKKDTTGFVKP